MDPRRRQGAAGQVKGPDQRLIKNWPASPSANCSPAPQIIIPNGERLGKQGHRGRGPERPWATSLIEDLTSLPPGGIVGVIGPNGAGKSTLFR